MEGTEWPCQWLHRLASIPGIQALKSLIIEGCILPSSCKYRCPCRHIWGLRSDVKDNLHVIADTTIIYPAGHNIIIRNLESQPQQFIQPPLDSEGILGLTLAPNQRHVAVTERAERATVTIYDLQTLKRRKVLSSADISGKVRVPRAQSSWESLVLRSYQVLHTDSAYGAAYRRSPV